VDVLTKVEALDKAIAELKLDKETLFGDTTTPLGKIFRTKEFWNYPYEVQVATVRSNLTGVTNVKPLPAAAGLFLTRIDLKRVMVVNYSSKKITWKLSDAQPIPGKQTSTFHHVRISHAKRAVDMYADVETGYSVIALFDQWTESNSLWSKKKTKNDMTKWWKQQKKDHPEWNIRFDPTDKRIVYATLPAQVLNARVLTQSITHSSSLKRDYGGPMIARADDVCQYELKHDLVEMMRGDLPDNDIIEVVSRPSDYDITFNTVGCKTCGDVKAFQTSYTNSDANTWLTSGSWPLLGYAGLNFSDRQSDDPSKASFALWIDMMNTGTSRAASSQHVPHSTSEYLTRRKSDEYVMTAALSEITDNIVTMTGEDFMFPATVTGRILGPIRKLRNMAEGEKWIDSSIAALQSEVLHEHALSEMIAGVFRRQAYGWMRGAVRKLTSHNTKTLVPDKDDTRMFVYASEVSVKSIAEHDAKKRIRYHGHDNPKTDITIHVANGFNRSITEQLGDSVILASHGTTMHTAGDIRELIETEVQRILNIPKVHVDIRALLVDSIYTKYGGNDEKQSVTFAKDYIGGSVWTNATLVDQHYLIDSLTRDEVETLQDMIFNAEDQDEVPALVDRCRKLIGEKVKLTQTPVLKSVIGGDVAVSALTSNLHKLVSTFGFINSGDTRRHWNVKGLDHLVMMPLGFPQLAAIVKQAVDAVLPRTFGEDTPRVSVTILKDAKLMNTKHKIDLRYVRISKAGFSEYPTIGHDDLVASTSNKGDSHFAYVQACVEDVSSKEEGPRV